MVPTEREDHIVVKVNEYDGEDLVEIQRSANAVGAQG